MAVPKCSLSSFLFVLCLLTQTLVAAVAIDDVFDVDRTKCGTVDLNDWFSDCQTLAEAAEKAAGTKGVKNSGNPRLLAALFDYKGSPVIAREMVGLVANFFTNGKLPSNLRSKPKPKLYCHSAWQVQKRWNEMYVDKNGNQPGTTIEEAYKDQIKNDGINKRSVVPYFWPGYNEYEFEQPGGYCSKAKNLGGTSEFITVNTKNARNSVERSPRVITLCVDNIQAAARGRPDLASVSGLATRQGISLRRFLTQSMTLFHESFHLLKGKEGSQDLYSYKLDEITKSTIPAESKRSNPESYVYFALAQHLEDTTTYNFDLLKSQNKP